MFKLWQNIILRPRARKFKVVKKINEHTTLISIYYIQYTANYHLIPALPLYSNIRTTCIHTHTHYRAQQLSHWKLSHKYQCKLGEYISGTKVKANTPPAPNPIDPSLPHPKGRTGNTKSDPLPGFMNFKYEKSSKPKARFIKPGKLTPFLNKSIQNDPDQTEFPYSQLSNQQVILPNGKYRHIASYSLEELCQLGWDGATYQGQTFEAEWVPFVNGYDSDPEHEYEEFDIMTAKRYGIVGQNDEGKYLATPGMGGRSSVVQLKVPRKER